MGPKPVLPNAVVVVVVGGLFPNSPPVVVAGAVEDPNAPEEVAGRPKRPPPEVLDVLPKPVAAVVEPNPPNPVVAVVVGFAASLRKVSQDSFIPRAQARTRLPKDASSSAEGGFRLLAETAYGVRREGLAPIEITRTRRAHLPKPAVPGLVVAPKADC